MKIWFDILTPKQVLFFGRTIALLKDSGHKVLCTSRRYREAIELARLKRLELAIVGYHASHRFEKLCASAERTIKLAKMVNQFSPDLAVTFGSPEASRVAYGLGIRQFTFNDSPHAAAVARLTVSLATKLYCPWVIPKSAFSCFGIAPSDIITYHALDPAAWLKYDNGNDRGGQSDDDPHNVPKVLIRAEESKASYVADKNLNTELMMDKIIHGLHSSADITMLCRYSDQIAHMESRYGKQIRILKHVVDGTELVKSARLFIGAGGTMTAESALLGKPTISITPFKFHVEKYLVKANLVRKVVDPEMIVRIARRMLSDTKYQQQQRKRAGKILASMEDPTLRIIQFVSSGGSTKKKSVSI